MSKIVKHIIGSEGDELLQRMSRVAKIGAWLVDLKENQPQWTDQIYDIHEVPRGEPITLEMAIGFYDGEEARERVQKLVADCIEKKESFDFVLPLRTRKDRRIWVRSLGYPEIEDDEVVRIFGVFQDITDQIEREQARLQLGERLELATSSSNLGIWDLNVISGELQWDSGMHSIYGTAPETFNGSFEDWSARVHPEDIEDITTSVQRVISEAGELDSSFRIFRADNGELTYVSVRARVYKNDAGESYRMVGVNQDISREILQSAKSEELERQLIQAQKLEAMGTLAGGIAHDFNNILGIVVGNSELAKLKSKQPAEVERHIDISLNACDRAKAIVQQLLQYARDRSLDINEINLSKALGDSATLLQVAVPDNISFKRSPCDQELFVRINEAQLQQVLVNFVTNAVQAIGECGGEIVLGLGCEELSADLETSFGSIPAGNYAVLSVTDDGPGIDEETLPRVLDPFFTTKAPGKGSGLGLSVAQGIIRTMSAFLDVKSTLGEGCSFRVYIPLLETKPEVGEMSAPSVPSLVSGKRFLVVDDDASVLITVEELLTSQGAEAVAVSSASSGLTLLEQGAKFDLVLCDFSMPEMTGKEFAEELVKRGIELPCILMSGRSDLLPQQLGGGVLSILPKPFRAAHLNEAVSDLFIATSS